jgi:hypothetical protein
VLGTAQGRDRKPIRAYGRGSPLKIEGATGRGVLGSNMAVRPLGESTTYIGK